MEHAVACGKIRQRLAFSCRGQRRARRSICSGNVPRASHLRTVSYTHLDVYKRQALYGVNRLIEEKQKDKDALGSVPTTEKEIRCAEELSDQIKAVSYTHLDVYKRQD